MFSWFKNLFSAAITRKKQDEAWAARFTNPPAGSNKPLPLDPGKSELS